MVCRRGDARAPVIYIPPAMRVRRNARRGTVACAVLAAALLAGCGGSDTTIAPGSQNVPAAGAETPPAGTPGVPKDALYNVDGSGWSHLSQKQKFDAANQFIADNPTRCKDVDVGAVVAYVTDSYFYDFPQTAAASEVLAEGCDASVQSPSDR